MNRANFILTSVLVLAIGLLVWGWHSSAVSQARTEALLKVRDDSLTAARVAVNNANNAYVGIKEAYGKDTLRLVVQRDTYKSKMYATGKKADSLAMVAESLASDTTVASVLQIAAFRELAATRLREALSCREALVSSDSLFGACRAAQAHADTLLANEHSLRLATERMMEDYKKLSHPGFLKRIGKGIPYFLVGAGVVCLLRC